MGTIRWILRQLGDPHVGQREVGDHVVIFLAKADDPLRRVVLHPLPAVPPGAEGDDVVQPRAAAVDLRVRLVLLGVVAVVRHELRPARGEREVALLGAPMVAGPAGAEEQRGLAGLPEVGAEHLADVADVPARPGSAARRAVPGPAGASTPTAARTAPIAVPRRRARPPAAARPAPDCARAPPPPHAPPVARWSPRRCRSRCHRWTASTRHRVSGSGGCPGVPATRSSVARRGAPR